MRIRLRRTDKVVDGAAVIRGVDDGGRFGREPGEILADRQPADVDIGRQKRLERHRRRDLAGANQVRAQLVDLLVNRLEEMRRLEKIGDAVKRLVVDQDGAEQRLLGLDIVRRDAVLRRGGFGQLADGRIEWGHDMRSEVLGCVEVGLAH